MANRTDLDVREFTAPDAIDADLRRELIDCWIAVSNGGGAAGFPFPPVDVEHVAPVADALFGRLHPDRGRLLVADWAGAPAGWVLLARDTNPLIAHWGTVHHLQTHPMFRGRGIGTALMRRLRDIARDELGLEQLHLAARGGVGLEDFYGRLGWREIGRWPAVLRLSARDTRDEVLMLLDPL